MGNIFLLYGPIDVLVRFDGFDYLKEFISKYFNPIRMIGGKERLLSKTTTYVAVIEGPSFWEQPFAFMFLNVQPQDAEIAQKKLLTLPHVIAADYVFGPCDLIVAVRAKDSIDLEKVVHSVLALRKRIQLSWRWLKSNKISSVRAKLPAFLWRI